MTRFAKKPITKAMIAAVHNFNARAYGKEGPEIPKARAPRVIKERTEPSESEILKAIMQLLKTHPKVAKVWRQNSGTFQMQHGDKTRYIRANTARGMSDIMGILKDGRTLAIEVKSRTGKIHEHQRAFLLTIHQAGGMAFVARSVDDVIAKLGE